MKSIDIGINLTDPMFIGKYRGKQVHPSDLDAILERAKSHGVEQMLITGVNWKGSVDAQKLAEQYSLYSTAGFHPTHATEWNSGSLSKLRELLQKPRIKAIGECGLDYDRLHFAPKEAQLPVFEEHFLLAQEFQLPMFLHCRNSADDFISIVRKHRDKFTTGVVHSFTDSLEVALEMINLDLYIGINGCSMKTEENLEMVKGLPLDRIMVETDAPWCDIRPTHVSFRFATIPFEQKKKEKFEMGKMVKSRNEPCTIG
jgi:TatD DNase family protein